MYFWTASWSFARYIEKWAARTSDGASKRVGPGSAGVAGAAAAVLAAGAGVAVDFFESEGTRPANTNPATGSASTATAIARRLRYVLRIWSRATRRERILANSASRSRWVRSSRSKKRGVISIQVAA